ncbi:MAG: MFS transporter [Bdellovibrio sp.]|nr:MFS transporter [Bdellovibrio sp.]
MTPKWWVLASVACGTFMATLDSSIVNIALPTLTKELGPDLYRVKWVVIVYLLVITCSLLPLGRLSDEKGRKPVFQSGYFIFILGSALCGLAPHLGWLVVFRIVQALGASMLMANGPAIITSTFSPRERGAALGTLAMVVSAGLMSGPSVGGFLIGHFGWRSIFWVNIPIGTLGIVLVHYFVRREGKNKLAQGFDWAGAFIQSLLLLLLMVFFDPPKVSFSGGNPRPISRWLLGAGIFLLILVFNRVEKEVKAPLFDAGLVRNRTFWVANLAGFLIFVAFSAVTVLMPFFLEEVHHFTAQRAGGFMTAIPLTIFVTAPIAGRLSDRFGSQVLSVLGTGVGVISLFIMAGAFGAGVHEQTGEAGLILGLCSVGLATGLFQSPNNSAIMGAVPINKLGVASAVLATIRNLGLILGTSIGTSLFTWRFAVTGNFVSALHTTLYGAGVVAVGALLVSLMKRNYPEGTHHE